MICDKHFTPESYKRDLKAELLNLPRKKILLPDTVPSLHLTGIPKVVQTKKVGFSIMDIFSELKNPWLLQN